MNSEKLSKTGELSYIFAALTTCFGVALMTKADLGLSMVVAPAYILSERFDFLSFGTAEYVVQAFLLIVLFASLRRFEWRFLLTFVSALIYGAVLDLMILITNASAVPDSLALRIVLFFVGLIISDLGVSLYFNSYLPPCCYDMFVREFSRGLKLNFDKTKLTYDVLSFVFAVVMSFIFFRDIHGIGVGTVVCVFLNGFFISVFNRLLAKITDFSPALPKLYAFISSK